MSAQPAPASSTGAGCPICGGSCSAFPDVPHRADYPFLPGGEPIMAEKTADQRLYDANGVLVAGPGAPVPNGVELFDEAGKPVGDAKTSSTSTKRAPVRETR